jgi:hypothetical protein
MSRACSAVLDKPACNIYSQDVSKIEITCMFDLFLFDLFLFDLYLLENRLPSTSIYFPPLVDLNTSMHMLISTFTQYIALLVRETVWLIYYCGLVVHGPQYDT